MSAPARVPAEMRTAPLLVRPAQVDAPAKHFALLINPFYPKDPHASFGKHVLTPTLALTTVAASTPEHWEVEYWDENLLQGSPPVDRIPEVVGITVHLTFARRAYALAKYFRSLGSIVVFGGLHVLSCPEEVAEHANAVAVGDGVTLWPRILADHESGQLQARYEADFTLPYRDEPAPRRELVPRESFLTTASLIATRGCHNRCGFCYLATDGLRMPYRMRDVEQVVEEFLATDQPYAVFLDNNLGSKPEYLRSLCHALRPLDRIWSAAVSIDVTDDPSLIRDMALAGCTGVFVGFESLTDENIADAGKKSPRAQDYARRVELFHENGIQVNGSFVLGFDHDGPEVFDNLVEWVEANRLECATFHILTPYPGTPFYERMESEGRILHYDWNRYDTANVVFEPKLMSPTELQDGYSECYRRLFSHRSIWKRRPRDWRALPSYLGMSYLYKRSNWFWHLLIKLRLVEFVWRPMVNLTLRRHLKFRRKLAAKVARGKQGCVVSAGV